MQRGRSARAHTGQRVRAPWPLPYTRDVTYGGGGGRRGEGGEEEEERRTYVRTVRTHDKQQCMHTYVRTYVAGALQCGSSNDTAVLVPTHSTSTEYLVLILVLVLA